ncbi:hypothetical protein A1QO_04065 [Vibrio genomosp. F10 str. ZF-129]|uniref:Uncharacterized protein n=1 Tax=Vibrio genomosp. F10 str. ZF-129 TaxID=1187848 RepID=A0A1E5BJQ4_9VIBR|nr:hypothetical protein [Vibrio genomosp. F10]OEE37287.1 hypothetical protein A1QO_04065 [Vibrio genomosp. F10 str. ZF-129]
MSTNFFISTTESNVLYGSSDGSPSWVLKVLAGHFFRNNPIPCGLWFEAEELKQTYLESFNQTDIEADVMPFKAGTGDFDYHINAGGYITIIKTDHDEQSHEVGPFSELKHYKNKTCKYSEVLEIREILKQLRQSGVAVKPKDHLKDLYWLLEPMNENLDGWLYDSFNKVKGTDIVIATYAHGAHALVSINGRYYGANDTINAQTKSSQAIADANFGYVWSLQNQLLLCEWVEKIKELVTADEIWLPENNPVWGDSSVATYLHGRCHIFALAAAKLNPNIKLMYDWDCHAHGENKGALAHVYCSIDDELFDARGKITKEVVSDYHLGIEMMEAELISPSELEGNCTDAIWGSMLDNELDSIQKFIRTNKSFYPKGAF